MPKEHYKNKRPDPSTPAGSAPVWRDGGSSGEEHLLQPPKTVDPAVFVQGSVVAAADARMELNAGSGEATWTPPPREFRRIAQRPVYGRRGAGRIRFRRNTNLSPTVISHLRCASLTPPLPPQRCRRGRPSRPDRSAPRRCDAPRSPQARRRPRRPRGQEARSPDGRSVDRGPQREEFGGLNWGAAFSAGSWRSGWQRSSRRFSAPPARRSG